MTQIFRDDQPLPILRKFARGPSTRGMTLVEIMVVCAIIGTLAAIAIPAYARYRETSQSVKTIVDMTAIEDDVALHFMNTGSLPDALADIGRDDLRDPWGNPYHYGVVANMKKGKLRKDRFLVPLNSDFDLYSSGPDGLSVPPLTAKHSRDDFIRANDGGYIGPASKF